LIKKYSKQEKKSMEATALKLGQKFAIGNSGFLILDQIGLDHMVAHPDVSPQALQEALQKFGDIVLDANNKCFRFVDMSDTLHSGLSLCLARNKISLNDQVLFAYRKGRDLPIPAIEAEPISAKILAVGVIYNKDKQHFELNTAYWCTGPSAKGAWSQFLDQQEFDEGMEFWRNNALAISPDDSVVTATFNEMLNKHPVQNPEFLRSYLERYSD
jgi:hypothetical protein